MARIESSSLPSGLPIHRIEIDGTRATTVLVAFDAGARTERADENGMAHFLEHLVFKGGEKYDDYRKVNETAERMGAVLNAYTSHDLVAFHITCRAEVVGEAIDLLTDFVGRPKIDAEELDRERGVVIQEIARANDQPSVVAEHLIDRAAFGDHPLGRPVLGPEEHLRSFTREAIVAFRSRQWAGVRGGAFLVGNLEHVPEDRELVESFGRFPSISPDGSTEPAPPFSPTTLVESRDSNQSHLRISYRPEIDPRDPSQRAALGVYSTLLGGSMGSRLFDEIREQRGLAYSVYSVDHSFADVPILQLSAGLESGKCVEAFTRMREIVTELRTDGPREEEFDRARAYAAGRRVLAFENTNAVARYAASQAVVFGQDIDPDEAIAALDRTTFDDVAKVARGISETASVACVGPHEVSEFTGTSNRIFRPVSLFPCGMVGFRLLFFVLLASLIAAAPADAQKKRKKPPKPLTVQLLAINDFHGYLKANPPGRVSRSGDPEATVPAGGIEYLATQIRNLKRRNPNTLVVAAGDLVGGSPLLSSLFHDEPTIEAMNQIPLDIATVGNHEFDEGAAELLRLQRGGCHPEDGCRDGTPFEGAAFRYLAANVELRSTKRTIFPPYTVRKLGGVKIGFIGETLKGTPELIPPQFAARLRFRDEVLIANRMARRLERRGVKAIVMLLHEGGFPVQEDVPIDDCPGLSGPIKSLVARTSDAIDLFITGHTHQIYNCVVDGRRVTSAGRYGRLLTRLELKINRRTRDIVKTTADNWIVGQDVAPAADMTSLIAHYDAIAAPIASKVIGRLTRGAGRTRDRSGEYRLGNLVADGQIASTGAAAAFVNPHIVRTGLPAGEITYGRAFTSLPFGSSLVTQSMTGGQIRELLKQQWCGRKNPEILQVSSSVSYTWSRSKAKAALGKPCSSDTDPITELSIRGNPVRSYQAFRITVNTTMLGRGAQFSILHTGTGETGGPVDVDSFQEYLAPSVAGTPIVPPPLSRIRVVP